MFNYNPMDWGYKCQAKNWPSNYNRTLYSVCNYFFKQTNVNYKKGGGLKICRTMHWTSEVNSSIACN